MPMRSKLVIFIVLVFGLLLVSPVEAKVMVQEKGSIRIPVGELINDDLFIGAETAAIDGTINGDVYIGAGNVNVSGRISGDLVIGAGTVVIERATIGDSLIIGAGTVTIDAQSRIGGSLLIGAGNVDNQASVGRHFFAGAGNLQLNGPIGREARFGVGKLRLGPKAVIGGDLIYASEEVIDQDKVAVVRGKITRHEQPQWQGFDRPEMKQKMIKAWKVAGLGMQAFSFLGSLVVGLTLLWLLPKPVQLVAEKINSKFSASLGWGLVMLFVVPPAILLLMLTGIGLPLAFIGGLLFIIDLYLAKIFASMAFGKVIAHLFGWKLKPASIFLVGLMAYYFLRLIPFIGIFVCLIALFAGLGGLWLYKKQLLAKK